MTEPKTGALAGEIEARPHHQVTVARIHWSSTFEFVHLFRAFRLAINPAKIVLGVFAVILIYLSGLLFDLAWGPQVYNDEIRNYQSQTSDSFRLPRQNRLEQREEQLRAALSSINGETGAHLSWEEIQSLSKRPRAAYRALKGMYVQRFHERLTRLEADRKAAESRPAELWPMGYPGLTPREREQRDRALEADQLQKSIIAARAMAGRGIFESLLGYELDQFDALVGNTLSFVRVAPVQLNSEGNLSGWPSGEQTISGGLLSKNPTRLWRSDTVVGCAANMTITAPCWLFSATAPMQWRSADSNPWKAWGKTWGYRGLYLMSLVLLLAFWLVVLALAGAIVCRLTALEFAGNDKVSLFQTVAFAFEKLWNFLKAPLMPFAILLVIGLALTAVGLVGAIPWAGELLIGLLFVFFLAVGFIMMLLVLGILGGLHLLYPTIAVEGSDSFDAMSRSFAYVYARPWKLIFYSIISLIYGVICFLFVAFAVYLLLALTHLFLGWGTSLFGELYAANTGSNKLEAIWPTPRFGALWGTVNWWALSWTEYVGAWLLHAWMFLLMAALTAFVASFYFCSNTVIYFLLRRSVDGQSLAEVYASAAASAEMPAETATETPKAAPETGGK